MKATPKSCNCQQCKHSKRSRIGKLRTKMYERAFRHLSNQKLRQGRDDFGPAWSRPR